VELTPGEIKAKTPRIPRIPRIREKVFHPILGQVAPVQKYYLPGLLNPWNPRRFCFLAQFALQAAGKGPETGRPAIARLPVPSGTEVVQMLDFTALGRFMRWTSLLITFLRAPGPLDSIFGF